VKAEKQMLAAVDRARYVDTSRFTLLPPGSVMVCKPSIRCLLLELPPEPPLPRKSNQEFNACIR
jgi:hypothetical protein